MLLRSDPFADFFALARPDVATPSAGVGAMSAYRHGDVITVEFDLPGVDPSTIDVQVERGELRLAAQRRSAAPQGARYLIKERIDATVSRRVMLGDVLDVEHVDAEFKDGVLTLRIPLRDTAKPRQISVRHSGADEAAELSVETTVTGSAGPASPKS
jgi:HSP20 family protein